MNALKNLLQLSQNFFAVGVFVGLFAIAALSLISLSPISLEDYNSYLAAAEDPLADDGTVAGVVDSPDNRGLVIENLLEGANYAYDYAEADGKIILNLSSEYRANYDRSISLLRFQNEGFNDASFQVELEYAGESSTKAAITTTQYLKRHETSDLIYKLVLPPGEEEEITLVRDVEDSFAEYELRQPYNVVVTIKYLEPLERLP